MCVNDKQTCLLGLAHSSVGVTVESEIETFWASDGRRREIGFDLSIEWRVMSNRPYFTQQKKNSTMNSTNNDKEFLNEFFFVFIVIFPKPFSWLVGFNKSRFPL